MAHSPSGSHVAATSVGNEAFTDAVAEDGGDSKLSALLFAIVRPRLVVADAEFPSSCFLRGIFDAGVRGLSPPLVSVAWFQCVLRIATNLVHIHPILLDEIASDTSSIFLLLEWTRYCSESENGALLLYLQSKSGDPSYHIIPYSFDCVPLSNLKATF
ncbi:uncharacterized protein [Zea mays]|uniref:uncharacterized protein isoform X2 n=1 Tax=Zea mays TaxID=4577 RepID=UPI000C6C833A|nr:uncharacterized protein LOC100278188 isoform X2 [Zea mays]|eukprot:XP_023156023.1 uncharacterized protein LOC100278188 isoform X2 [Zea mays]